LTNKKEHEKIYWFCFTMYISILSQNRKKYNADEVNYLTPFQKQLIKIFPYAFILFLNVYITGLAPRFWGDNAYYFSNFMLNFGLLAVFGVANFIYGLKNGFTWYMILLGPIFYLSTIFLFYNGEAGCYINLLVYTVFSLVFHLTGSAIYRRREYIRSAMQKNKKED